MEKLEIKVTKTSISVSNAYVLNQGEYQVDKCSFNFSEEYEGLVKKAIFIDSANNLEFEMVILNDECDIPYEILQKSKEFTMKVYGYKVENNELIVRYSPTSLEVFLREGSYQGSKEVITPSQFEQYEQALHDGLEEVNTRVDEIEEEIDDKIVEIDNTLSGKVAEVDNKLDEVDDTLEDVNHAIDETNNLNLDVSKQGKVATVTLTKKDTSTKVVTLNDGTSLMFNWDGTKLGIKTDEEAEYTYVDLKGPQGDIGPQGEAFQIKKTYSTIQAMINDYDNMEINDYVMISGNVEQEDNAKLFVKTEEEDPTYRWQYLADFSGASGIQGPTGLTPNIQIGSVTSGSTPSVTRTGTNENPILNFVLQKGDKGDTGDTGPQGVGIASIVKTSTSGLVDTYTITYDNGTTSTFQITNGEDGEVTQAQLDDTNREVNKYKTIYNVLPKVENETISSEVELDGTGEAYMKLKPIGKVSQKPLPSEYTAVDYIESHGQEFINTNVPMSDIVKIEGKFAYTSTSVVQGFFGEYTSNNTTLQSILNSNTNMISLKWLSRLVSIDADTNKHSFAISNKETIIDGVVKSTYDLGKSSDNKNLILLCRRASEGGVQDYAFMRIYYFNIYDDNGQIREFIPCYRNSDNEVGMYDLINDVFYTNQGVGTFTYGSAITIPEPDHPQPIRYVTGDNNLKIENKDKTEEQNYPLNIGNYEMYTGDYFFKNEIDSEDYDSNLDLNAWYLKNNWGMVVLDDSNIDELVSSFDKTTFSKKCVYLQKEKLGLRINYAQKQILMNTYKEITLVENIDNGRFSTNFAQYFIIVFNDNFTDLETAKDLLKGTIMCYRLSTPTYTKITDTTLIGQLEAIDIANSYNEKTYITCTNSSIDNETLDVKAVALADLSDILNQTTTTSSSEL